jgi:tRNA threonylcarbamoyl adenosine modification protein (Sua5/YciO/YrdC/YwlC family)
MKHLPKILVSKRKTVGIRVPDSPATLALIKELGHPILSTSVTDGQGEIMNDPEKIADIYRDVVDVILDAGHLVSVPSTVLDLTGDQPKIIRQGAGDTSFLER